MTPFVPAAPEMEKSGYHTTAALQESGPTGSFIVFPGNRV
jgi:hypothetical protein